MTNTGPETGRFVLVVPWAFNNPGGVNQVVMNLYDQTEKALPGLPLILVKSWEHPRAEDSWIAGRRTRRWRFRDPFLSRNQFKAGMLFWAGLPVSIARLFLWMIRERIRVINAHYPGLWLLPFALLRCTGRPQTFLIALHGLDLQKAKEARGFRRWLWDRLMGAADRITACSEALARETRVAFPKIADRVEAVPNGVDSEHLQGQAQVPKAVAERLARGRHYIACAATFEAKKGQDVLLEAFADLAELWPELDLALAGRVADQLNPLRSQAHELGLAHRVLFLPDLDHALTQGVIRAADLFVLPSRYEPFGIVLLEAGVHAVPVVASRVGGVPEILPGPHFGRLVPPEDSHALREAIADLLRDPEERCALGQALQRRVYEHFSWQRVAQRYLEIAGLALIEQTEPMFSQEERP